MTAQAQSKPIKNMEKFRISAWVKKMGILKKL